MKFAAGVILSWIILLQLKLNHIDNENKCVVNDIYDYEIIYNCNFVLF